MTLDDIIAGIDNDPDVVLTVEQAFKNATNGNLVNLTYYRYLKTNYRSWQPLPYEQYKAFLQGRDKRAEELRRQADRKAHNDKIKRINRLQPK